MNKTCLIFGGSGALGRSLISHFKSLSIVTINIDYAPNPEASTNIKMEDPDRIWSSLENVLGSNSLDSIINVAGGWAGGNANASDLMEKTQLMFDQSVKSSVFATRIASKMLKESGLLVFVGAAAALEPTPGMLAYGMAKASVHHLVKSLGDSDSGLPKNAICTGICPVILDTPNNRKWMPNEDFSTWTPLEEIVKKFGEWTLKTQVPVSGGLYKLVTKDNVTSWDLVHAPFVIASTWNQDELISLSIASSQLWSCAVTKLETPPGMDKNIFINLLQQMFYSDTSAMIIHEKDGYLWLDCNHSADGLTFTLATFKLETIDGVFKFYQDAISALVGDNIKKTTSVTILEEKLGILQENNAKLEEELHGSVQQHLKSTAVFHTVFKRIVNSKKRKIRILQSKLTE